MALALLEYSYSFPSTMGNENPRVCRLAIKRDPDSFVFTEASETDKDIYPVNFSTKHYRFLVLIGNKIAYDSTSITPASQIDKTTLSGTVEITTSPLGTGGQTTTIKVPLTDKTSIVRIKVISVKPRVPMQNYTDIPELPQLKSNLLFHDRILPLDSFYVSQTIDQRDLQRILGIGIAIAFIPNFSSGIGVGYGTWQIYDKKSTSSPKDFSFENFDLFYRLSFEAVSVSSSLDIGLGAGPPFSLIGVAGGYQAAGSPTSSVAGSQRVEVSKTYEAQKLRYDHKNKDLKEVIKKVKENYGLYSAIYEIPKDAEEKETLPDFDVDKDGKKTIIDRITYLSSEIGFNSLGNEESTPDFKKDAVSELKTLIEKHSIVNKPCVIKDLTGLSEVTSISYNGNVADSLSPLKVYKTKDFTNVYLVFEDGLPDKFEINDSSKYTIYCKCLCPDWSSHFDYFTYKNLSLILGISEDTLNILIPLFGSKSNADLTLIENPMILLLIRSKTIITTTNSYANTPAKVTVKNTNHNDSIVLQKDKEEDDPATPSQAEEVIRPGSFIANVPVDQEYTIEQVNYVQKDKLFSLIPGFDIQTRGAHGLFFTSEQEPDLAQPKIQGKLDSPWLLLNPLDDPDTLNGPDSILHKGSTLEVFSNMGRERGSSDFLSNLPFLSSLSSLGSIGGDLVYFFESVSTRPDILTPSLISFKSNLKSEEEYVVYKSENGDVVNYKILRGNNRLLSPVSNFSSTNVKFEKIHNGTVDSDCNSDVVQLNILNEEIVSVKRELNDFVINSTGNINTVSQIKLKFLSKVSNNFPYVLFYDGENGDSVAFGEMDQNGTIIPKIFNLNSNADCYLHCKNLNNVSNIVLKPALGINSTISFETLQSPVDLKCTLYGPQETDLSKNPIAQMRLDNGSQYIILEISSDSNSPTLIAAAEINVMDSKINYPSIYTKEQKEIESNSRLEKFNQTDFVASNKTATKDQYMLLGYFDEANVIEERDVFYIIGFLYDSSGGKSNTLASIPIPKQQLSNGKSVFGIHRNYDQYLSGKPVETSKEEDKERFPFFVVDNSNDFIVEKDLKNKQKPGIAKINKNGTKMIFMADENGKALCYINDNICRQWKKMPDKFVENLFNYRETIIGKDGKPSENSFNNQKEIKFIRFACSKETFSDEIDLFAFCEIKGSRYFVLMKKITFDVINYYSKYAVLTSLKEKPTYIIDKDEEKPFLDKINSRKPVLAIGDPNLILPDKNLAIRVGNSKFIEKDKKYISLNLLLNDGQTDSNEQTVTEQTLNKLQNIDISQDFVHGITKIYFINNKGHRDAKASLNSGQTFQSYKSF